MGGRSREISLSAVWCPVLLYVSYQGCCRVFGVLHTTHVREVRRGWMSPSTGLVVSRKSSKRRPVCDQSECVIRVSVWGRQQVGVKHPVPVTSWPRLRLAWGCTVDELRGIDVEASTAPAARTRHCFLAMLASASASAAGRGSTRVDVRSHHDDQPCMRACTWAWLTSMSGGEGCEEAFQKF